MGNPTVANIIKSGAVLWFAPVGTADPDETGVTSGSAWGIDTGSAGWQRVGYTKAPLTFAYEDEQIDIETEEELAPVKRLRTKENITLETALAELSAATLQLALGNQGSITTTPSGSSQRAYEETTLGGVAEIMEMKWGFEGIYLDDSGNDFPIRFFIHKGTAKLNGALEFSQKSGEYVGIPIQIKALADSTQSAGNKLCKFQRVTAEHSS